MNDDGYRINNTRLGFSWGPANVVRVLEDKRYGVLLAVVGKRSVVEIRVTPGGRVRVVAQRKPHKHELDEK